MNVLFYFPTNKRSNSLETLLFAFKDMGHQVFLLGMESEGEIHAVVSAQGIHSSIYNPPRRPAFSYYIKHARNLVRFINTTNIDIVYSHTQPANIISVFAQFFVKARVIICRHHSDYIMKGENRMAKIFDSTINRLGRGFIVPSKKVFEQITEIEGVKPNKVRLIPYAYDFSEYPKPNLKEVEKIRNSFPCDLLLVTVSRFIPCKRYELLIDVVNKLLSNKCDVKLLILGNGPLETSLKHQVKSNRIEDRIEFIGFTTEVMNYLKVADVVVHTSNSEASNSVIKEAGLLGQLVIACRGVGDFNDYITNRENGLLVSKENTFDELYDLLLEIIEDRSRFTHLGTELRKSVLEHFSYESIIPMYTELTES